VNCMCTATEATATDSARSPVPMWATGPATPPPGSAPAAGPHPLPTDATQLPRSHPTTRPPRSAPPPRVPRCARRSLPGPRRSQRTRSQRTRSQRTWSQRTRSHIQRPHGIRTALPAALRPTRRGREQARIRHPRTQTTPGGESTGGRLKRSPQSRSVTPRRRPTRLRRRLLPAADRGGRPPFPDHAGGPRTASATAGRIAASPAANRGWPVPGTATAG